MSFMTGRVFVDSNVLVYSKDASEGEKQQRAAEWIAALFDSDEGRISFQVLHECFYTLTRRLRKPLSAGEARALVDSLLTWNPVPLDDRTLRGAWSLLDRHQLSFWDALIVAAARIAGCQILLTEDLQEGMNFGGILVVNPFTLGPGDRPGAGPGV